MSDKRKEVRIINNPETGAVEMYCVLYCVESAPILKCTDFEINVMAESASTLENAIAVADAKAKVEKQARYDAANTAFAKSVSDSANVGPVNF